MTPTLSKLMKINSLLVLLAATSLSAAPVTKPTPVHPRPDAASPAIMVLNPGTEPTPALGSAINLPVGWTAIEIDGARDAYIQNKDLTKSLDVRPGSAFRTQPKADAPIFSTMQPGDQVEITGYHGKWTQVKVTKRIIGYVQGWSPAAAAATAAAPAASAPVAQSRPATPPPFSPAPAAPAAVTGGGPGHAAQMVDLGDGGSASLPRLFQGKFVSTKSLLRPRRPYDYQLNDSAGERYAYVDISRLLQTEQIEKYIDRTVTVYGTAKPVAGTKDIVIEAESLQLR
ncbi:hypothetical protein DB347_11490 [Opitutaceae bacterium EW11]|nr:hypothetical protein DB347_11490 [Opitutaceae bacterium EW11]